MRVTPYILLIAGCLLVYWHNQGGAADNASYCLPGQIRQQAVFVAQEMTSEELERAAAIDPNVTDKAQALADAFGYKTALQMHEYFRNVFGSSGTLGFALVVLAPIDWIARRRLRMKALAAAPVARSAASVVLSTSSDE